MERRLYRTSAALAGAGARELHPPSDRAADGLDQRIDVLQLGQVVQVAADEADLGTYSDKHKHDLK